MEAGSIGIKGEQNSSPQQQQQQGDRKSSKHHHHHHHHHNASHGPYTSAGSTSKKPRTSNAGPTTSTATPLDTGVGQHLYTKLIYAVGYLKEHPNNPIRLEELAAFSNVEELQTNAEMLAAFRAHEKVMYDEKTDLYQYKPDFLIRNNAELLALLRRYSPRGGMMVKKLQESWPNARSAIEELEKEGKVMVIRTGANAEREGVMKVVFWNELGSVPKIDNEFSTMWHSLKLPDPVTIGRELEEAGMKTTAAVAADSPAATADKKKGKGKKGGNRKIKLQNTHLKELGIDLSKDFLKPGTPQR